MHFLRLNAVNMINDVIKTAKSISIYYQFHFLSVLEIIKLNNSNVERKIEYVHSVVLYQKFLTLLRERITFPSRLENYQFSLPRKTSFI